MTDYKTWHPITGDIVYFLDGNKVYGADVLFGEPGINDIRLNIHFKNYDSKGSLKYTTADIGVYIFKDRKDAIKEIKE